MMEGQGGLWDAAQRHTRLGGPRSAALTPSRGVAAQGADAIAFMPHAHGLHAPGESAMGYLCAEIVISLSSGRQIAFRGGGSDAQPRFAARAPEGEAIAALEFAAGQLIAVCTTAADWSEAGARGGPGGGDAAPP